MKITFTITVDIDEQQFLAKAGEVTQAATESGNVSVEPVSRAYETSDRQHFSKAGTTDGRQHGGGEEPAAADRHAPIQESPRKAAEAVPERAAQSDVVSMASESAKSAGEVTGTHLPINSAGSSSGRTSDFDSENAGSNPAPVANERCLSRGECKFSHHPQKITCSACGSAWAAKMKTAVAA